MITIKLFALFKERAGAGELLVPDTPATVRELLAEIMRTRSELGEILAAGRYLVAVNQELADPDARLRDGDEVALLPPFSGGGKGEGLISIQKEPFSADTEVRRIKGASSAIGGIVTFIGTTRDLSREKRVVRLEFEHYAGMAEKKLWDIRSQAIRKHGAIDVTIIHRIGTIRVGEDIVLIVAAAMHRDAAFAACRFCIDELKRTAPIWKKEIAADGEVWVEEHP